MCSRLISELRGRPLPPKFTQICVPITHVDDCNEINWFISNIYLLLGLIFLSCTPGYDMLQNAFYGIHTRLLLGTRGTKESSEWFLERSWSGGGGRGRPRDDYRTDGHQEMRRGGAAAMPPLAKARPRLLAQCAAIANRVAHLAVESAFASLYATLPTSQAAGTPRARASG